MCIVVSRNFRATQKETKASTKLFSLHSLGFPKRMDRFVFPCTTYAKLCHSPILPSSIAIAVFEPGGDALAFARRGGQENSESTLVPSATGTTNPIGDEPHGERLLPRSLSTVHDQDTRICLRCLLTLGNTKQAWSVA